MGQFLFNVSIKSIRRHRVPSVAQPGIAHLLWEQRVAGSNPATRTNLIKVIYMTREQLKIQAIFRLVVFFAIAITIGFIASDINILSSQ